MVEHFRWLWASVAILLVRQLQCMCWEFGARELAAKSTSFNRSLPRQNQEEWVLWTKTQSKFYASSTEEAERYATWQSNKAYIENHNRNSHKYGYALRMNQFGDLDVTITDSNVLGCMTGSVLMHQQKGWKRKWLHVTLETPQEYAQMVQCVETPRKNSFTNITYFDADSYSGGNLPAMVDWRDKGVITSVKNQGRCRSCYAFSVTGAMEAMHALDTGRLVSLSEQNIIDCTVPYGNRGCSGGSRLNTILYAIDSGGVDDESSYPYNARQYLCMFSEEAIGATCRGIVYIRRGREKHLQKAVAVVGPVTVAVDSRQSSFQFYSDGIYNEALCSRKRLTHSMLVVGYGTLNRTDYWLLKNSWGIHWGMNGYIMMARNMANQCGIATRALYPTT